MNNIIILLLLGSLVFTACSETIQKDTTTNVAMQDSTETAETIISDFSNIPFASKRDTICHMPLSAGILDTAIAGGKIYGFCSKECKDAFVKTLQAKH